MVGCWCKYPSQHFHCAQRYATLKLAHLLDSLVRVSRRVKQKHFASNCVPGLVSSSRVGPASRNEQLQKHQTHASKHKSSQTHAIQTPQENYHSCARVIKCTNRNWQAKQESSHPQSKPIVKQAPQSHQATSNLFIFCSANTNSFNYLFKVFFIFPSWYLCAISLNPIFTFT